MFETFEVKTIHGQFKPFIRKILDCVNTLYFQGGKKEIQHLQAELMATKDNSRWNQDDVLNEFYVLNTYVAMLSSYSDLWEKIVKTEFTSSWNSLQDALDQLRTVKKFSGHDANQGIDFFEYQLTELEKLYPYNVFFSIGAIVECCECSICGKDIDSFDCPHRRGELYRGEMAYGTFRNIISLDHVSMVKHPADKRCVVQYDDNEEQFKLIRFLSELISFRKLKPLEFGDLRFSKRKIKNPDYREIGRNKPCYCGSGKKFKRCCISLEFIDNDHVDIVAKSVNTDEIVT